MTLTNKELQDYKNKEHIKITKELSNKIDYIILNKEIENKPKNYSDFMPLEKF